MEAGAEVDIKDSARFTPHRKQNGRQRLPSLNLSESDTQPTTTEPRETEGPQISDQHLGADPAPGRSGIEGRVPDTPDTKRTRYQIDTVPSE